MIVSPVVRVARLAAAVRATASEIRATRPGDDVVDPADVVMDRGVDVPAPPAEVWPWIVQLGKGRAGWYLPRRVERWLPARHRAARVVDPRWQTLAPGDVVPDYGGRDATFTVHAVDPPSALVYRSRRGRTAVSWSITLHPTGSPLGTSTRIHLRLRLGPVRRRWLATTAGELFDALTIAGMAAGLRERVTQPTPSPGAARRSAR